MTDRKFKNKNNNSYSKISFSKKKDKRIYINSKSRCFDCELDMISNNKNPIKANPSKCFDCE